MDYLDYLPKDFSENTHLVGRYFRANIGPSLFALKGNDVFDITAFGPTMNLLLEREDVLELAGEYVGSVEELFTNTLTGEQLETQNHLLSPCDLQAIKACGVTFPVSMIERVIEERAGGDSQKAKAIRDKISSILKGKIEDIEPGSENAKAIKKYLIEENLWSAYLEVGIGPYAEIFTKTQPMSSVGLGHPIGILPYSNWNNPEPEIVLIVNSKRKIVGATLGNDVNLRDIEGLSALLLGKAKDNNASCAVGPFIRLFDKDFGLDQIRNTIVELEVSDESGKSVLKDSSNMKFISRDPEDLVTQVMGENHQYPDGMALFLGTMFAPSRDRDGHNNSKGFTHELGDQVSITNEFLGRLKNKVMHTNKIKPWSFGVTKLFYNLSKRNLIN